MAGAILCHFCDSFKSARYISAVFLERPTIPCAVLMHSAVYLSVVFISTITASHITFFTPAYVDCFLHELIFGTKLANSTTLSRFKCSSPDFTA